MVCENADFNLVDEPWIRVRMAGGTEDEMSIKAVFRRAKEIVCLSNDLATQDFAILRMLLAILHRAVEPVLGEYETPSDAWSALWADGDIPLDLVNNYLEFWHQRFELFDDESPFMQVAGMRATNGSLSEVKKIVADVPDNQPLFSMRSGSGLDSLSYAEAARWLVHVQSFDTSGIKTGVVGDKDVKGGKSYPIGTGWSGRLGGVYAEGDCLAHTLLLNLDLCGDCYEGGFEKFVAVGDLPIWEREPQEPGDSGYVPTGPCSLYTWQSRRVLLCARDGRVTEVLLSNGDRIETHNKLRLEPMSGWRRSPNQEKKLRMTPVYLPVTHRAGRSMWRGLTSLLPEWGQAADMVAPGVLMWIGHLGDPQEVGALDSNYLIKLHAAGIEYGVQSAVVTELIDDSLRMSAFLLSPEGSGARLVAKECMAATDEAIRVLGLLAKRICLACGDDPERAGSEQQAAIAEAYFELDSSFRNWLSTLDADSVLLEARHRWMGIAQNKLWQLGQKQVSDAGPDAIVGRKARVGRKDEWITVAKAESQYRYRLKKILPIDDE